MNFTLTNISAMRGGRPVLERISAEIPSGRLTVVIGPNGAGKSTLLRLLAGLIESVAGQLLIDGRAREAWSAAARARAIAYVAQERVVHWSLPVRTLVGLGRLPHRREGAAETAADGRAIDAALAAMDAGLLAHRAADALSGGELARVLIARALAQAPRALIADEPAAGLDPAHQLSLFRHLRTIAAGGVTVVAALHDLSFAVRFADHAILLGGGGVLASGMPRDVLTPELIGRAYGVSAVIADVDGVPVVLARELLP
jgi:iron complex transport system ATP-binding protein